MTVENNTIKTIPIEEPSFLEKIIDCVGSAQTLWCIITTLACFLFFILCVFFLNRNLKKQNNTLIEKFTKEKKYIPSLYIELNNNMEKLRYFIFSNRWKQRIIYQYNSAFKGKNGALFKKYFKKEFCYRLSCRSSISTIRGEISKTMLLMEEINKEHKEYRERFEELYFKLRNFAYQYKDYLEQLDQYCIMVETKNLLIAGSAGNGKTSLLCRVTEMANSNKIPCMLINSRDIQGDCIDYVLGRLPLSFLDIRFRKKLLHIINLLMYIQNKNFYIIIDAINENDNKKFINSISSLCNYIEKFKRIKLVFSCRTEYFSCRYKSFFEKCKSSPFVFNLLEENYDRRAIEKLMLSYSDFYNIHGGVPEKLNDKLLNSLFLMRIFFEVNENQSLDNLELRNAEIYKKYIDKIVAENPDIDFRSIIDRLTGKMIESQNYDLVKLSELHLTAHERKTFLGLLDNNLVVSRTMKKGKGITENEEEYIHFVFDEFRDYCLARKLLSDSEEVEDLQYTRLFELIDVMYLEKLSPIEGVIKYSYYHFKEMEAYDCCEKMLEQYGKQNVSYISTKDYYRRKQVEIFDDFGLSLTFLDNQELLDIEYNYVKRTINSSKRSLEDVFWFLLKNECECIKPRFDLFMRLILDGMSFQVLSTFLTELTMDIDIYYPYEKESSIDIFKRALKGIYKRYGKISNALKKFIIICSACKKHSFYGEEYERYGINENYIAEFVDEINNVELKEVVKKYSENFIHKPSEEDAIKFLREMFRMCEEYGN